MEKALVQTTLILFSGWTIWSVQPGSSLFSWHPTFMVISQFLCMEGVLLYKIVRSKWKVTVHWIFQVSSLICLMGAFIVIFMNKEFNERPHFTSNHGLAGLCTLIIMITQSIGGVLTKYSTKLSKYIPSKQIKVFHRFLGIFSLVFSLVTVFIVTPHKLFYTVAVIFPSLLIFVNILFKVNIGLKLKQGKW